ncbi:MAG: lipid-A-disaccharide synthase [Alphaproteobacteria bacterium]|nr:lipid-A-disaccharide synthase [Alphaproteobacteria bacterium]
MFNNQKFYFIVGEASGDLHASYVLKYLKSINPNVICQGWGGDLMQAQDCKIVKHYKELAFMGFWEVIKNLPEILKNFKRCKTDILNFKPDLVVFVDYPGFNLKMAAWAKNNGFKTAYYISPQVWAWKANRVIQMKKNIDLLLSIIPFEKDYFKKNWQWEICYVGSPLLEELEDKILNTYHETKPIIALLPGSRKQEIKKILPQFLELSTHLKDKFQFIVAGISINGQGFYQQLLTHHPHVFIIYDDSYSLIKNAQFALVTSGTATMQTALLETPMIVCYKTSWLTFLLAKLFVKIKYIAMINLILNIEAVPELIQNEFNTNNLLYHLNRLANNPAEKMTMIQHYKTLKILLKCTESPSKSVAEKLLSM